jgi:hypothetical protein
MRQPVAEKLLLRRAWKNVSLSKAKKARKTGATHEMWEI